MEKDKQVVMELKEAEFKFPVAERFVSINGEGRFAGRLACFIRFARCNLDCAYCDTKWANEKGVPTDMLSVDELVDFAARSGVRQVTLTGGEPLLQPHLSDLVHALLAARIDGEETLTVEIETNGSADVRDLAKLRTAMDDDATERGVLRNAEYDGSVGVELGDEQMWQCVKTGVDETGERLIFTMDYKLPSSGMESAINTANFEVLNRGDVVKFVVGSVQDLERMQEVIRDFKLAGRVRLYVSPVFGQIAPADIVAFMKERRLNEVTLQLQLHKIIWPEVSKGV